VAAAVKASEIFAIELARIIIIIVLFAQQYNNMHVYINAI